MGKSPKQKKPKEFPLVGRKGIALISLLGALVAGAAVAWPDMAPQLVVTILGVTLGVVAADIFLIRREAKIAFRSILTAPEAKGFLEGWRDFRKLLNDASHWWAEHGDEVRETAEKLAAMTKDLADKYQTSPPKRKKVHKLRAATRGRARRG